MTRERMPSRPMLEPTDEPRAISVAAFDAHLRAHQQLEQELQTARKSDSLALKSPGGWTIKGKAGYILLVVFMALADVALWLLTR